MSEKPILFIWDFHGVLEKDNELAVLEVTNRVLEEFGHDVRATLADINRMYGLRWGDYYRRLVPVIGDSEVEEMVLRSRELGRPAASRHAKPQDHAVAVLKEIREKGHRNVVISNTAQGDLEFFMDLVGVLCYIDEAHGTGWGLEIGKAEVIKRYASGGDYRKIVVIGDTERDIDAGLSADALTYLFRPRGHDVGTNAHKTINDLREVLTEFE
jgi:phosphoglycolate phosphatase-like HAD superfamily hydrolase